MSHISHKTVTDPILVAGIQIRTTNASELDGTGKIGGLWQRFFSENLLDHIPNRTSDSFYAIYSNYESDEYGAYDYLLGASVASIDVLPEGMTFAAIPTGGYAVVTTEKGSVIAMVQGTWREIWNMAPDELGGKRAFLTDYEVYDHRAADPQNAQVEIHLGLEAEAA